MQDGSNAANPTGDRSPAPAHRAGTHSNQALLQAAGTVIRYHADRAAGRSLVNAAPPATPPLEPAP